LRDRSFRQQYDEEVDQAVELYKESLPRNAILSIGDEAVAAIRQQMQIGLTELLLCDEVNRIIKRRLGIKDYPAWRRQKLRILKEYRRALGPAARERHRPRDPARSRITRAARR
jgi:hypothetical protein